MKSKENKFVLKKQNRTVIEKRFYTDDGKELAFFHDDGKGSAVLYLHSVRKDTPKYKTDIKAIKALYPNTPCSEYLNA